MPRPGTTTARGYGTHHKTKRAEIQRRMDRGERFTCWRCTKELRPDESWDLGHDDHDRTRYRGPEHVACNRATSSRRTAKPTAPTLRTSRRW